MHCCVNHFRCSLYVRCSSFSNYYLWTNYFLCICRHVLVLQKNLCKGLRAQLALSCATTNYYVIICVYYVCLCSIVTGCACCMLPFLARLKKIQTIIYNRPTRRYPTHVCSIAFIAMRHACILRLSFNDASIELLPAKERLFTFTKYFNLIVFPRQVAFVKYSKWCN